MKFLAAPTPNLHVRLGRQSLRRPLTAVEQALASALEKIFGAGVHDFAAVAAELTKAKVARPSGDKGDWTEQTLEEELARINADLDDHYARTPLL